MPGDHVVDEDDDDDVDGSYINDELGSRCPPREEGDKNEKPPTMS